MLHVKVKKLHPDAKIPTRAFSGDAGADLYSVEDVWIGSGRQKEVSIGLAFEIPLGWQMQIHTRSSFGRKELRCHLGIIDCGYRNSVTIFVQNLSEEGYSIKKGDKICQAIFLPVPEVEFEEVSELAESDRGLNGVGSSGR